MDSSGNSDIIRDTVHRKTEKPRGLGRTPSRCRGVPEYYIVTGTVVYSREGGKRLGGGHSEL